MGCVRSCADFSPGDLGLVDGLNPAVVGGSGGAGVSSPSTSPKCTGTRALHPPTPTPASPAWLHRGAQRAGAGPFPYKGRFFWRPIWCGESNPRCAVSKCSVSALISISPRGQGRRGGPGVPPAAGHSSSGPASWCPGGAGGVLGWAQGGLGTCCAPLGLSGYPAPREASGEAKL